MGLVSTDKVVIRAEYYGQQVVLQPGNHEWVTVVESINASGWVLPPCMIFKGKRFIQGWFDDLQETDALSSLQVGGLPIK